MSSSESRSRRIRTGLAVLATAALTAVAAAPASAAPADGSATIVLAPQQQGKGLLAQGVRIAYSAKAGKTGATKSAKARGGHKGGAGPISLPVTDLLLREAATVRTGGALVLSLDGRRARLRSLIVQVSGRHTAISAKLGKRRLIVLRANGQSEVDGVTVKLRKAPLSLTGKAARALRSRLGLDSLSGGRIGALSLNARLTESGGPIDDKKPKGPDPLVDPYAAQCALDVTSRVDGEADGPDPAPTLTSPTAVTTGKIEWGFQKSFREYVFFSGGALVPIGSAEVLNPPLPAPQTGSFRYPAASGEYAVNDSVDSGDDQVVLDGTGEIVLCNDPHGFRVTLSNPTVTLDGDESRLTVDVDTNMSGIHTPAQRVDLATLDLDAVDPFYNENAKTVSWSNLPVTLTAAGSEALQLCNPMAPGPCSYEAGDSLEPLSLTASTETEVAWPFAASCTVGSPAKASAWPAIPAAPSALPALSSPEAVAAGSIEWGLRNSLRNTVQSNGVFNLAGGATRSDAVDMSGPGKYFAWPASAGEYEAGSPGRLVLHGGGSVGICNTAHGYGTVLANPTVVIDGASSRLVMDVASRIGVSWTSGRVEIASLAIGDVVTETLADTPSAGQETVRWTFPDLGADDAPGGGDDDTDSANSSVKLSEAGASTLSLINLKTAGTSLNKVTVSIVRTED